MALSNSSIRYFGTSRITNTDRKSTRLNSSHGYISYAVFCLKKKKKRFNMSLRVDNSFSGTGGRLVSLIGDADVCVALQTGASTIDDVIKTVCNKQDSRIFSR